MSARILIIEDNPTNMELMAYLLSAFGHGVMQATTGSQGLDLSDRERPDLVICYIELPDVNGYDIARRVRRGGGLSGMPLVAVTAYAMVGDKDTALDAGFDGYITKPIDLETFVPQVEDFLRDRQ